MSPLSRSVAYGLLAGLALASFALVRPVLLAAGLPGVTAPGGLASYVGSNAVGLALIRRVLHVLAGVAVPRRRVRAALLHDGAAGGLALGAVLGLGLTSATAGLGVLAGVHLGLTPLAAWAGGGWRERDEDPSGRWDALRSGAGGRVGVIAVLGVGLGAWLVLIQGTPVGTGPDGTAFGAGDVGLLEAVPALAVLPVLIAGWLALAAWVAAVVTVYRRWTTEPLPGGSPLAVRLAVAATGAGVVGGVLALGIPALSVWPALPLATTIGTTLAACAVAGRTAAPTDR